MALSDKFLKPDQDGKYSARQSEILCGLWTPYGLMLASSIGIWPDGTVDVTYTLQNGAKFYDVQKRKIQYVEERGVKVHIIPLIPKVPE